MDGKLFFSPVVGYVHHESLPVRPCLAYTPNSSLIIATDLCQFGLKSLTRVWKSMMLSFHIFRH